MFKIFLRCSFMIVGAVIGRPKRLPLEGKLAKIFDF